MLPAIKMAIVEEKLFAELFKLPESQDAKTTKLNPAKAKSSDSDEKAAKKSASKKDEGDEKPAKKPSTRSTKAKKEE